MKKLLLSAAGVAGAFAAGMILPAPGLAQDRTTGEILVYGTDPCPRSTDDQVVICRRMPETMRYRLPENMRPSGTTQQRNSWANRSQVLKTIGDTGTGSCSAVGPGGHTGCLVQSIREAREQTRQQAEDNRPPE